MKTIDQLYDDMSQDFTRRTGMEVAGGGDLSARLYAAAAQLYALYVQADWVNRQCFPQTAQGEYLDYHAQLRALERKAASQAQGVIRFYGDADSATARVIPQGTVCMTPGLVRFATTREGVLPAGESHVDISAQAVEAGGAGNVIAGSIRTLSVPPVGITGCINPEAFTGGADQEGDEKLRERILDSFRRLPNGANAAFYEQGALSFEEVAAAAALPRNRGVGTVDVVVATPQGMPDSTLLGRLEEFFRQRREIAVDVKVLPPELVTVNLSIQLAVTAGRDFDAVAEEVERTLRGWFSGQRLGQNVLRARLGSLVFTVDGVENYRIDTPAADVTIAKQQLPVLGTVTLEAMA